MKVIHRRCGGLDVHKDTVVASARIAHGNRVEREVRTFGTTTKQLMELGDWLESRGCHVVAMEATGVYWKPVWYVLEERFELVLANAAHIKNVPGRKTDVRDAEWISDLLAHGLIRPSFVPPQPIQELRDLTRTRKQLGREIVQHTQRIQKVLETANVKLRSVVSNVLGQTGRAVVEALIAGTQDPDALLALKHHRIRASDEAFAEALQGRVGEHHRFLLQLHLTQIDALQQAIAHLDDRVEEVLGPFRESVELLKTIPGFSDVMAQLVLAEIGDDMTVFPSSAHLLSWACLCPRNDESAGKRRSSRTRKGGTWLKAQMVQAAWAAVRTKDTYLHAQFLRLRARRGPKKAIVAVAASMLTAAYHVLRDRQVYQDLGPQYLDRRKTEATASRLVRRLRGLGFDVTITPATPAA